MLKFNKMHGKLAVERYYYIIRAFNNLRKLMKITLQ